MTLDVNNGDSYHRVKTVHRVNFISKVFLQWVCTLHTPSCYTEPIGCKKKWCIKGEEEKRKTVCLIPCLHVDSPIGYVSILYLLSSSSFMLSFFQWYFQFYVFYLSNNLNSYNGRSNETGDSVYAEGYSKVCWQHVVLLSSHIPPCCVYSLPLCWKLNASFSH